jgi:hypothetical protein
MSNRTTDLAKIESIEAIALEEEAYSNAFMSELKEKLMLKLVKALKPQLKRAGKSIGAALTKENQMVVLMPVKGELQLVIIDRKILKRWDIPINAIVDNLPFEEILSIINKVSKDKEKKNGKES